MPWWTGPTVLQTLDEFKVSEPPDNQPLRFPIQDVYRFDERRILAGRGFSSYGRKLSEGHWRVFFHLDGGADWERGAEVEVTPEGAMTWREDDGIHMDVRKLTPPNPLLSIIRLIESIPGHETVVVHHDREPQLLAPELAERGWHIARMASEVVNIRLWLERLP